MTFLLPLAGILAALAVPVILFYLIRQKLRVRTVTTLLFWENLTPKVHNLPLWRKLRRLVSLLLQLILLALLITAVARPIRKGQSALASSLVLVLDPSVTMAAKSGERTRWQDAMDKASHQIDALGFGDEATLIVAGDQPRILSSWTGRKAELHRLLDTLVIGTTVTDIRPALRLAQNLIVSRPGAVIEVISDTVWSAQPDKELFEHVTLDLIGSTVPNSGLTLLSARTMPAGAGDFELAAKIEQNTGAPVSGELTLMRNGQMMDVVSVTVPADHPWQKSWRGQTTEAANFTATWKPQGKAGFDPDKQASAHLDPVRIIKTTLVSPPQGFIEFAFGSLGSLVRVKRVEAMPAGGDGSDLYVFHAVAPPEGWNLAGKSTVLINPTTAGFWGQPVGPIDKPLVTDQEENAAVLRFVDLSSVQIHSATEFKLPEGAKIYAGSFGKPLVYGHWDSEPRWLVLAFDLEQSDMVLRTAFPILCANLVQTLRPEAAADRGGVPGPIATRMKSLASSSGSANAGVVTITGHWWSVIPFWWWFAVVGFLLLLAEWLLYTRRVTE